jgi:hypothetical protein
MEAPLFEVHTATLWVNITAGIVLAAVGAGFAALVHFFGARFPTSGDPKDFVDDADRRTTITFVGVGAVWVGVVALAASTGITDFPGIVSVSTAQAMPYIMLWSYAGFLYALIYATTIFLRFDSLVFYDLSHVFVAVQWLIWFFMMQTPGWQGAWGGVAFQIVFSATFAVITVGTSTLLKKPLNPKTLIAANFMPTVLLVLFQLLATFGFFWMTTFMREWHNLGLTSMFVYHLALISVALIAFSVVFWFAVAWRTPIDGEYEITDPRAFLPQAYLKALELADANNISLGTGKNIGHERAYRKAL